MNPGTSITYNGNSLQTSSILTDNIDHMNLPTIDAKQYPLAHANLSKIPFIAYPSRVINITGTLIGGSIVGLDALIDTFKGYLVGSDLPLVIGWNNTTRNYTATVTKLTINRPGGLTFAKFQVEFTCNIPFGYAPTTSTCWSASNQTSLPLTNTYTFLGTAPYQLPVTTITVTQSQTSSTDLISNSTFESGLTGWSSGGVGTASQSSTYAHSGTYSMKMINAATATNGNYGWEYFNLSGLAVGTEYNLTAWLRGGAGGEVVSMSAAGVSASATLTTSWQQVSLTFTATATTQEIDFISTSPANGTWYLDDVYAYAVSAATISFGNNSNGQQISVTRSWAFGDVLVIDCGQKTVTVNGNNVQFTGGFPEFPPGSQTLLYNDNFLSRTVSISSVYYPGYM